MKKLLTNTLVAILLCSCSPWKEAPITDDQLTLLEYEEAIKDWQLTEEGTDECSSPANIKWLASACLDRNWFDCCKQHDFDYRHGWKYHITKEQADYALWECVNAAGPTVVANLMYDAVFIFGRLHYNNGSE